MKTTHIKNVIIFSCKTLVSVELNKFSVLLSFALKSSSVVF